MSECIACSTCLPQDASPPPGLPQNFSYLLCENSRSNDGSSSIVLRCRGSTVNDAKDWLKDFSSESRSTWRVLCSHPESGRKNVCKMEYRCQHNTRHKRSNSAKRKPSAISKNMECPAKLSITIKRVAKRCRSQDKHLPLYPMVIQFRNEHNHDSDCLAVLRHRDVSAEVRDKFRDFYVNHGHSPSSALAFHVHDLHQELDDLVHEALGDRARCPDRGWVYSYYYKVLNKEYREKAPDVKIDNMTSLLSDYNKKLGEECSRLICVDNSDVACVIITPLMRRNHQLNYRSAETVFIEFSGKTLRDKESIKCYMLFCDSEAGGIPLGLLLVTSIIETVLTEALKTYRAMLTSNMHYGRGSLGPKIFIIDDFPVLRSSLANAFPHCSVFLNTLTLLHWTWRHLCVPGNGVVMAKKIEMIELTKKLLYSTSKEALEQTFYEIESNSELSEQYSKFLEYLRSLYAKRESWGAFYIRQKLQQKGGQRNVALGQAAMRVNKDSILHRLRSFDLPQMTHFIFTRLDTYFGRRLEDVANDREIVATKRRFLVGKTPIPRENITQPGGTYFHVNDGTSLVHEVDFSIFSCTCKVGMTASSLCKHQLAIAQHFQTLLSASSLVSTTPCSDYDQFLLYQIATGSKIVIPGTWFRQRPEVDQASVHHDEFSQPPEDITGQEEHILSLPAHDLSLHLPSSPTDQQLLCLPTVQEQGGLIQVTESTMDHLNQVPTHVPVLVMARNTLLLDKHDTVISNAHPHSHPSPPLGETSENQHQEEEDPNSLHKFNCILSKLKERYLRDPLLYGPALERFCSAMEDLPGDGSIVPSLLNFGRLTTTASSSGEQSAYRTNVSQHAASESAQDWF